MFTRGKGNILHCQLCPHQCMLKPGQTGLCRVRSNENGKLALPYRGKISAMAVDPIEKKPLYHFLPGTTCLSIGFFGCQMRCPYCQNWRISQKKPPLETLSVHQLIETAERLQSPSVAFTYSEPLVHAEFLLEAAPRLQQAGFKTILVTNGMVLPEAADLIIRCFDAFNVDLKSFSANFYRNVLKGHLQTVLSFIEKASEKHIEITRLLDPLQSTSVEDMSLWLSRLSPNIPLHLSICYPAFQIEAPPTTPSVLIKSLKEARQHLHYVYPGNSTLDTSTFCPNCGIELVKRRGAFIESHLSNGHCPSCGNRIYGKWD